MEKRPYQQHPPRYEYRLTQKGIDLWPVVMTLMKWGDRNLPAGRKPPVVVEHKGCGGKVDDYLTCTQVRQAADRLRHDAETRPGRVAQGRAQAAVPAAEQAEVDRARPPLPTDPSTRLARMNRFLAFALCCLMIGASAGCGDGSDGGTTTTAVGGNNQGSLGPTNDPEAQVQARSRQAGQDRAAHLRPRAAMRAAPATLRATPARHARTPRDRRAADGRPGHDQDLRRRLRRAADSDRLGPGRLQDRRPDLQAHQRLPDRRLEDSSSRCCRPALRASGAYFSTFSNSITNTSVSLGAIDGGEPCAP